MKLKGLGILAAVLLAALPIRGAAAEETGCWAGFFDYYYHSTQRCALASTVSPITQKDAEAQGKYPCPVCVDDTATYGGVDSTARGGTLVIRVPDAWMTDRPVGQTEDNFDRFESRSYDGADVDAVLAEQLHGADYRAMVEALGAGSEGRLVARVPDIAPDAGGLMMNKRHIGNAWYLTYRPGPEGRKTLDKKKKLSVDLAFVVNTLTLRYDALKQSATLDVFGGGLWEDESYTLKPKKSKNKTAFTGEYDGLSLAVYPDMNVNICVLHLADADPTAMTGAALLVDGVDHGILLNGYASDGEGIFCGVLTDAETAALKSGAIASLSLTSDPSARSLNDFEALLNANAPQEEEAPAETALPTEPPMPVAIPEDASLASHTPAFARAGYNSCTDTSRRAVGTDATLVQAGNTVFALNCLYGDSSDWGPSDYELVRYPAGQPEQAVTLVPEIKLSNLTLYDTGSDLLLWDGVAAHTLRVNYDGSDPRTAADFLQGETRADCLLFAGDWVYYRAGGIKRAPLAGGPGETLYEDAYGPSVAHNSDVGAAMVFAGGRLYALDGGIVAIDVDTGAATRLIDEYDETSGSCGLGYIVLGNELYTWSPTRRRIVAIDAQTGESRDVTETRYYFSQVAPDGAVLAMTGARGGGWFANYDSVAFYLPSNPARPAFDPDRCVSHPVQDDQFLLGDWLYNQAAPGEWRAAEKPW